MSRIISIVNQNYGVGKTTTSLNLGHALGYLGKKTLIIDLDPQSTMSNNFGLKSRDVKFNLFDCFVKNINIKDLLLKTKLKNIDLIPSNIDLITAEIELINKPEREEFLKKNIKTLENNYDYIIIDTPPSLGLLTVNALTCSHSIITPIECEYFALEGLGKLFNVVKIIQSRLNPSLIIDGLLLTKFDTRLRLSSQVVDDTKSHFQDLVFENIIYKNNKIKEASDNLTSIINYDINSRAAQNFINLAKELDDRIHAKLSKEEKTDFLEA
ncbi:MAG: chromosome partitioning protein ParA [Flavobacteriales bacterium]|nr:chromosome partitioning protein ParA [Flavobacteriales bacterium]